MRDGETRVTHEGATRGVATGGQAPPLQMLAGFARLGTSEAARTNVESTFSRIKCKFGDSLQQDGYRDGQ